MTKNTEVTIEELDGPDPLDTALKEEGLTLKAFVRSLKVRRDLLEQTFSKRKRISTKDVPLLNVWRQEDQLLAMIAGFKKAEKHEHLVETLEDRLRRIHEEREAKEQCFGIGSTANPENQSLSTLKH